MENAAIIGIGIGVDLAKRSLQLHGARGYGSVAFRKKLTREGFLPFLADRPACIVAMEACATAHGWGREIVKLGHEARLIPTQYVKPYVKRHKNDMADAEAIAEAASRPTMRFVAVESEESRARAMLFRTRHTRRKSHGRVEDWRASFRVRWLVRRLRTGPQSGSHGRVSSPCSSNRTCGFPSSGFRTRSCLRSGKAHSHSRKAHEAIIVV